MFTELSSLLLKCLLASMAFGFFMSFLWLFSLILNDVSDFPTYYTTGSIMVELG